MMVSGASPQQTPAVPHALHEALTANYRLLFAVAYAVAGNRHDAEDVVQSTAMKACREIGRIRNPASIVSWLVKAARNTALDLRRKGGRTRIVSLDGLCTEPQCPRQQFRPPAAEYGPIYRAIAALPPGESAAVVLRFLEDLSLPEVALRLGIRPGAARVRLHRAMKKLMADRRLRRAYANES